MKLLHFTTECQFPKLLLCKNNKLPPNVHQSKAEEQNFRRPVLLQIRARLPKEVREAIAHGVQETVHG